MYQLDREQRSTFFSHLRQHTDLFKNGCPACGTDDFYDFGLLNEIITDRTADDVSAGRSQPGSPSRVPIVRLVCRECFHILSFDLRSIEGIKLDKDSS